MGPQNAPRGNEACTKMREQRRKEYPKKPPRQGKGYPYQQKKESLAKRKVANWAIITDDPESANETSTDERSDKDRAQKEVALDGPVDGS